MVSARVALADLLLLVTGGQAGQLLVGMVSAGLLSPELICAAMLGSKERDRSS